MATPGKRRAYGLTYYVTLDETQTANWHDPDDAVAHHAKRLIRRDIREEARSKGCMQVEISDDDGIVVDAWSVVT